MGGKGSFLLSLVLVIGLFPAMVWGQDNILTNGEFDAGLSGWFMAGVTGYEVRVVQDAGLSGDYAGVIDVTDQVATDEISFSQDISNLVRGQSYPLSFIGMAEASREMAVMIEVYKPWGQTLFSETVRLTETPQLFTFQYYHSDDTLSSHSSWSAALHCILKRSDISMAGDNLNAKVWIDRINLGGQAESFDADLARNPKPADGAGDVRRDLVLNWTPGSSAVVHDVYFGTSYNNVNSASRSSTKGVLISRGQSDNSYEVGGLLDLGQTYYWRIDSVGSYSGQGIVKGDVWSFTAEPEGYPITNISATASYADSGQNANNTINGSGLNNADQHSTAGSDMWLASSGGQTPWIQFQFDQPYKLHEMQVWNYNAQPTLGARDVTVLYSDNGASWTTLQNVEFNRASGTSSYTYNTTVAFDGITTRYVRLTINSNWGGGDSYGLSEVRFLHLPSQAREPSPADGTSGVDLDTVLCWRSGRETQSHKVYLGVSQWAVANGSAWVDTVTNNSYDPGRFDLGTVYYWRIDEIDGAGAALWQSEVWRFSTQEFSPIEDFESYTDDIGAGQAIWQTWIDGIDDVHNGNSIVGYSQSPFAEQVIVHGGEQSLPLIYNNNGPPFYSETYRTWQTPQNWTAGAADTLKLYFRGDPSNTPERLYLVVEDNAGRTKMVRHSDPSASCLAGWQSWTLSFDTFASAGVNITSVSTMIIGLGNRDNPTPGGNGTVLVDDIAIGSPVD